MKKNEMEMTEQEIMDFLKKNKKMGIAFAFMPKEVQKWARENSRKLCCYNQPIESTEFKWMRDDFYKQINQDGLYALPDDFEPEGYWDEYDIKDGYFYEEQRGIFYAWYEWPKCMSDNSRFTAFGGWQYEDSKRWYLAPAVKLQDGKMWNSYIIEESGEAAPVIPIKIRFWKKRL